VVSSGDDPMSSLLPDYLRDEPSILEELISQGVQSKVLEPTGAPEQGVSDNVLHPVEYEVSYQAPKRIKRRRAPSAYTAPKRSRTDREHNGYRFELNKFLCTVATDMLNHGFHVLGIPSLPTVEEFSSQLLEVLETRARLQDDYDRATNGRDRGAITYTEAEELAQDVAAFALNSWDPAFFTTAAERGRRGGQKSRRGKNYTQADLAAVEGLSKADAAAKLGCSESTIARLRREARGLG
jgi:cobalamin biosynthesis Mg chelatase CobN